MVEIVAARTLYHVTTNDRHNSALTVGQRLRAGDAHNPFFRYYEEPNRYPIHQPDGSIVQLQGLAVLHNVAAGNIPAADVNVPEFARVAYEVARNYKMLARELLMEEERLRLASDAPSRLTCLWCCETVEQAETWREKYFRGGAICKLECTGKILRVDSALLMGDGEPLSETRIRAARYWRAETSENPEMEILFEGDFEVVSVVAATSKPMEMTTTA